MTIFFVPICRRLHFFTISAAPGVREIIDSGLDHIEAGLDRLTACGPSGHDSCEAFCKVYYKKPEGVCKFNEKERKDECFCEGERGSLR